MAASKAEAPGLGRLVPVDIRSHWQHEARGFTPWLAEEDNLALLGDAIGLELELEATEQSVGPFAADIVCKRRPDGQRVVIENQIEKTDHTHLGQVITYAAGLHATTVIWIARQFADEHRAALDWLNEHTPEDVAFFGITVELWKIGDSLAAPRFNVVARPNGWAKQVRENAGRPERQKTIREYWIAFANVVEENPGNLKAPPPSTAKWVSLAVGDSGASINACIVPAENSIRVEFYLSGAAAKQRFDELAAQRADIDSRITGLEWQRLDAGRGCRIALVKRNTDPLDREDWPSQHHWLRETAKQFHAVFRPLIKRLDAGTPAAGNGERAADADEKV